MILSQVRIHHVRNICSAQLNLHPKFNFIFGPNGSGKSSILESLYLLTCGHSFRSRENSNIVSNDQEVMTVFGMGNDESTISIQKSLSDLTQIRLNNQACTATSQLAYTLPSLVIYSDVFQIIDAGPSVRRSVLDWGLFHVKHEYHKIWKEYKRALKQRNALLRARAKYSEFVPWDKQLNEFSNQLDDLRREYFNNWEDKFRFVLSELTDSISCEISYFKGWDRKNTGKELLQVLEEHFDSDMHKQYTQYGSHQADISITNTHGKVKGVLSRGQQKIILIALRLAQGLLLDKDCLYLLDDLNSELDDNNYRRVVDYICKQKGQFVITGVANSVVESVGIDDCTVFNISHGLIG